MILRFSSSARISQGVEVEWDLRIVNKYTGNLGGGTVKNEERNFCILFFFFFFNDSSATKLYPSFKESTCNGNIIMAGS